MPRHLHPLPGRTPGLQPVAPPVCSGTPYPVALQVCNPGSGNPFAQSQPRSARRDSRSHACKCTCQVPTPGLQGMYSRFHPRSERRVPLMLHTRRHERCGAGPCGWPGPSRPPAVGAWIDPGSGPGSANIGPGRPTRLPLASSPLVASLACVTFGEGGVAHPPGEGGRGWPVFLPLFLSVFFRASYHTHTPREGAGAHQP